MIGSRRKAQHLTLDSNGEPYKRLTMCAIIAGDPYSILKKYVCKDENKKRRKIGK
jgi:hypothetical protein